MTYQLQIISEAAGFHALAEPWRELSAAATVASLFSSYDFVSMAWRHFHGPKQRLMILVLRRNEQIEAIVPMMVSRDSYRGMPVRVVKFIASWEGDRPNMVCRGESSQAWNQVLDFFQCEFKDWDVLQLIEQDVSAQLHLHPLFHHRSITSQFLPDGIDYWADLRSTWEEFLAGRKSSVRQNYRNRARKLSGLPGGYQVERINSAEAMPSAFERFINLEGRSWRQGASHTGVNKNPDHCKFNRDLILRLAELGLADIYFLRHAEADIAAAIMYRHRDIVYERHLAYDQAFAKFSPGIVLKAEILSSLSGGAYRECDYLCLGSQPERKGHSREWATGERPTQRLIAYRRTWRNLPLLMGMLVKRRLGRGKVEEVEGTADADLDS